MITPFVRIAAAAATGIVTAAVLAGCATSTQGTAAPASSAPTASAAPTSSAAASSAAADPQADEAAVRQTYDAYNQSLIARDFTTTCSILTEDAVSKISAAIAQNGGPAGLSCEDAFKAVYSNAQAAGQLDEAARSLTITDVKVSGDTATVTYGGSVGGRTVSDLKQTMTKIAGKWRVESTA